MFMYVSMDAVHYTRFRPTVNGVNKNQSNVKTSKTEICFNEKRAGELGGIETVVKVLSIHINNNSVCKWGSRALWNMIFNSKQNELILNNLSNTGYASDENRVKAGKAGAIEIAVNVMCMRINNFDTCISGCKAIANMVNVNCKKMNYVHEKY